MTIFNTAIDIHSPVEVVGVEEAVEAVAARFGDTPVVVPV